MRTETNNLAKFQTLIKVKDFILKNPILLFSILVIFIIRIPRTKFIYGSDSFEIIWMAQSFFYGGLFSGKTWLIHPLSYFGFYSFSHYPIGLPLVLYVMLCFGIPITASIIILDFIITFIGISSIIKLTKYMFKSKLFVNISVIFYGILSIDFYKLTYITIQPRSVIIAFTPLFLYYLLKCLEKPRVKSYVILFLIFIGMLFMHRIAILYIIYLLFIPAYKILKILKIKDRLKRMRIYSYRKLIFSVIVLACLIIGFILLPITYGSSWSPIFSNDNVFGSIINLIINYFTRLSPLLIFLPIGINVILHNKSDILDRKSKFLLLYSLIFVSLSWTKQLYSVVIFMPVFVCLIILGLDNFIKFINKRESIKIDGSQLAISVILVISILFNLLYQILVDFKMTYIVTGVVIILSIIIYVLLNFSSKIPEIFNKKNHHLFFALIICGTFFSLTVFEGNELLSQQTHKEGSTFSSVRMSQDELEIIDFINQYESPDLIITNTIGLSRRIGGYGFFPTIRGEHFPQQLYYDWYNKSIVKENSFFDFFHFLRTLNFNTNLLSYEDFIIWQIIDLDINNDTDYNKLISLNIQYIISYKNPNNNTVYANFIRSDIGIFSTLLYSLNNLTPSFETEALYLWKLY